MAKIPSPTREEIERLWKEIIGEDPLHELVIPQHASKMEKTLELTKKERPKLSKPMAKNSPRPQLNNKIASSVASTSLPDQIVKRTKLVKRSVKTKKELLSDRAISSEVPNVK